MKNKGSDPMTVKNIGILKQELSDFKDEIISRFDRVEKKIDGIDVQTRKTNGRVTTLEIKEETCTARKFYADGATKKDWTMVIVSFLSALLSAAIVFGSTILFKIG